MKLNDAVFGFFFLALALVVIWQAWSMPQLTGQGFGAGTFPMIVAVIMAGCGISLVISGLRAPAVTPWVVIDPWLRKPGALTRMASVPVLVILYIVLSGRIGFPILVPILLTGMLWLTTKRLLLSIIVAISTSACIWFLFVRILAVPLPLGLLTEVIY
ncbi:tripartite tricarboxylate transporter TctB family protein [Chelativorans sp. AA-79]|uniref:tripartite tricarboxylate transporter TctB family protein n=1 Tax=Chelativorans sp. AA-79 TaxID=3028735 RepID=UPI0023F783C7|nr:tripartite tricarboxylate transporter TctB family protein [Chelativorans sp. AA-79]WEX10985.1 tripartite tricarboxylate transporter TctB family protein [Chelativorans sp. AA-79]